MLIPTFIINPTMKKITSQARLYAATLFTFLSFTGYTQVNLPYTLHFTSGSANWSNGIVRDGDGGTQNINGLDVEVFSSNGNFRDLQPVGTMTWHDNNYFMSGHTDYHGITPGPDATVTNEGIAEMIIKSSDPAVNFSLTNIRLYDWGGHPAVTITTYNNGSFVGSILVKFDQVNYKTKTLTQATGLPAGIFENIDEIIFTPYSGTQFRLSMNDIGLAAVAVLPVTLTSFTAAPQPNNTVLFNWVTQQELNSHHFEIEHSFDGVIFIKKGEVPAKGNSNVATHYSLTSKLLAIGTHFFRLKQIDVDGRAAYSKTLVVSITGAAGLQLYPNPLHDKLNISGADGIIRQVKVFNASGSLVKEELFNAANVSIDLSKLPKALYYVDIVTDKETVRRQVLKQ